MPAVQKRYALALSLSLLVGLLYALVSRDRGRPSLSLTVDSPSACAATIETTPGPEDAFVALMPVELEQGITTLTTPELPISASRVRLALHQCSFPQVTTTVLELGAHKTRWLGQRAHDEWATAQVGEERYLVADMHLTAVRYQWRRAGIAALLVLIGVVLATSEWGRAKTAALSKQLEGRVRAHTVFAAAAFLFGVGFAIANPPFRSPDEGVHFVAAYALSSGQTMFFPEVVDGKPALGAWLPKNLMTLAFETFGEAASKDTDLSLRVVREHSSEQPSDLVFIGHAPVYSPLPYVPSAIAIALGRLFNAPVLVTLYLARFAHCLVWAIGLFIGLRLMRPYQLALGVALSVPMLTFIAAMMSVDPTVNAAALIGCGCVWRLIYDPDSSNNVRFRVAAVLCFVFLAFCKMPYAFFALTLLAIPSRQGALVKRLASRELLAAIPVVVAFLWGVMQSRLLSKYAGLDNPRRGISISQQLHGILRDPLSVLDVLERTFANFTLSWMEQAVGVLSSLELHFPAYLWIVSAMAVSVLFASATAVPARLKFWAFAAAAISVLATLGLLYLTWTPVADPLIWGFQGRYFLPCTVCALWLMSGLLPPLRAPRWIWWSVTVGMNLFGLFMVGARFQQWRF